MVIAPGVIDKGVIYTGKRTHQDIIDEYKLSTNHERVFILDDGQVMDRWAAFKYVNTIKQRIGSSETRKLTKEPLLELHSDDVWPYLNLELAQTIVNNINLTKSLNVQRLPKHKPLTELQGLRQLLEREPEY